MKRQMKNCLLTVMVSLYVLWYVTPVAAEQTKVLVFSKTSGFRHSSISAGISLIQSLGSDNGFEVDRTEDSRDFNELNLSQYGAVVWLNTTGNVLTRVQQSAFEGYIQGGGGYVGIHSAADTEYDWAWYGDLLGGDAWFQSHPHRQTAVIDVEDYGHLSTHH